MSVLLSENQPDEVYHAATQSHVSLIFDEHEYTSDTTGLGTIRLDAIGRRSWSVGSTRRPVQRRSVPRRRPRTRPALSPAITMWHLELFAYWAARNDREVYGLFIVNGIRFNHESPRRGETFVTRKDHPRRSADPGRA
jgi:GDPmannose 4,6-dehydratase